MAGSGSRIFYGFAMEALFELKDVYFSYLKKFPALCGVSITVHKGETISLMGANGTGKSTLLAMLDGLIFPDKGSIRSFGNELTEPLLGDEKFSQFFRSHVGFVFQNPDVQLFCPTVKEDIVFGPLQLGVSVQEVKKRLERLVQDLGIADLLERAPHQLSIGEKRKVTIASVLILEPEVIILDEPTAGLDPMTTRHIIDILYDSHKDGKTIITATHDLHVAQEISDTLYVLGRQRTIARAAPPGEIVKDERFLMENNLIHIHSHRHQEMTHVHPHNHLHPEHHG